MWEDVEGFGGWMLLGGSGGRPLPRRPGHPPLVSLRSLAPPYAEAKGAGWCTPLSCGGKGRERSERGMRGDGKGLGAWNVEAEGIEGGVAADVEGFAVLVAEGAVGGALFGY